MYQKKQQQTIQTTYYGVDLSAYQCHKLVPDQIYSKYKKQELHYPIGAIQKGLKPHTKIGIKRIQKRNKKIKQKIKNDSRTRTSSPDQFIKKLKVKSPQQICMKALRKEFRDELQKNFMQDQSLKNKQQALRNARSRRARRIIKKIKIQKQMSQCQKKRKQNQKMRRLELNILVSKYKTHLIKIFGQQRFRGYGRCPKISRQQIWKALNFTPEEIECFYQKYVIKLQEKQQQKNQDQNIDIKLLRLSTHKFATSIQFIINQGQTLVLPFPFPNNQIYLDLRSLNKISYQFYPSKQQKKYLTRYVSSKQVWLLKEDQVNLDHFRINRANNDNESEKFYRLISTIKGFLTLKAFKNSFPNNQNAYIQNDNKDIYQISLQVKQSQNNQIFINIQQLISKSGIIFWRESISNNLIATYDLQLINQERRKNFVKHFITTCVILQRKDQQLSMDLQNLQSVKNNLNQQKSEIQLQHQIRE